MISTASAPASLATAVSASVSSSLADPVPGTNGTRSAISSAAALIAVARSVVDCADGSPVDPPREMPWLPDSSCQRIRLRSPSRSAAPSAVNGDTTGAIEPRILAGSLLNRTRLLLSLGQLLSAGKPSLVGALPALAQRVKPVDGLALGHHRGGELLLQFLLGGVLATSIARCAGITMTPSPSPTMMSPGSTVTPAHAIVALTSHGT